MDETTVQWIVILSVVIICFFIIVCFYIMGAIGRLIKIKERQITLEESKFLAEFDYAGNKNMFNTFLDEFINDCMKDYIMYYIIPDSGLTYINKDRENQIRNGLKSLVVNRLSESLKKKITLIYSEIFFNQILAEKIFYVVTIYVADFNNGNQLTSQRPNRREQSPVVEDINDWGDRLKKK